MKTVYLIILWTLVSFSFSFASPVQAQNKAILTKPQAAIVQPGIQVVPFAPKPGINIYTVSQGETISGIASKFLAYSSVYTKKEFISTIISLNNLTGTLSPGQTIKIPIDFSEPLKPRTVQKPKNFIAKGVYINSSNSGTRFILETADALVKSGGNTIVFNAKDDIGAITYKSDIPKKYCPNENYTHNIQDIAKLVELLHRKGIHVVARIVVFRDPIMARTRPDWVFTKDFLNPAKPAVQDYMLTVIKEVANTGIDEIQLDYIRYHADTETSTGVEGKTRADIITDFVKRVREITSQKGILLSIDMFGIVIWQRPIDVMTVGQDVTMLSKYVDVVSPMLYPSHFQKGFSGINNPADEPYMFVYDGIEMMKSLVGNNVIVRPWLQAFPMGVSKEFGPWYMDAQIKATIESCATGWLFWSPQNRYTHSFAAMDLARQKKYSSPDCRAFLARLAEKKAAQAKAKEVQQASKPSAVNPKTSKPNVGMKSKGAN